MKVFQYVSLQIAYRHTTILLSILSFFLLHFHSFYIVLSQNTALVYSLILLSIKFMKEPILYGLIQVGLPLPKWQRSTHLFLLFGNVAFNVFAPTHIKSNLITVAVEKTVRQKGRSISQKTRPEVNCAEVCFPQATFPVDTG